MITNERQLQFSKVQALRFRESLAELEEGALEGSDLHPLMRQTQIDAVRGQLGSLLAEIREYEELRSGKTPIIELDSLAELPDGLIRARIAAGLTQKDLAERLGVHEQQIQRYEASRYQSATFSRIVDVADAIGLKVRKQLEILKTTSAEAVIKRLHSIGLGNDFIRRRISPDLNLNEAGAREIVMRVGSIFGWSPDVLFGSGTIDPMQLGGATARFKMPKGRDGRSTLVYTAYAYRLATICARAMAGKPQRKIPTDWRKFRGEMVEKYGSVDFKAALLFAWDLGVVVLPLNDAGAFHGACWRIGGVNVVALKQPLRYPARWLFDLLHELRHAGESPEADEFEVVEESETSNERRNSKEEQEASWFAGQVSLDGSAEEFVKECLALADNDLRRLKKAVQTVAARRRISASQLANYMAFRLSLQGENWWGVAANIQDKSFDPLAAARDVFFERFSFNDLPQSDSELLSLALHDEVLND
jgi:transcriptional regulator with XRE-family HTH domain/Zn-dependent peptidase ImmA (M78 family)